MDKVTLITGASSGIGEGLARELGGAGARVLVGSRRTDRIEAVAAEIRAAGGTAQARPLDVTDRESMAGFVRSAIDLWGRVDVLINNAGVMPLSPLSAVKQDEWDRMVDVNIKGVLWGIGVVLPLMEAQGRIMSLGMVYERRPSERSEAGQAATAGSLMVGLSVMRASVSRLM